MSKGHMIMLGGQIESLELTMDLNHAVVDTNMSKRVWTSARRSPGGHRIATYLREQDYDVPLFSVFSYEKCFICYCQSYN